MIIKINNSSFLGVVLTAVHFGGALLAIISPMLSLAKFGLVVALCSSLYLALRRHAQRTAVSSILAADFGEDGECALQLAGNPDWQAGQIVSRFVHPWAVVVTIRCPDRRWPIGLIIAADAVERETFRRLRVALRQQSAAA